MEESIDLAKEIREAFDLSEVDIKQYSPLVLAFIGDTIYDLIIRSILVEYINAPVHKLHKKASSLVKASAQTELFYQIESYLTKEELEVYKRGRNAKSFTSAKNATIIEYRIATGIEALFGYLYLMNQMYRIIELMKIGLKNREGEIF